MNAFLERHFSGSKHQIASSWLCLLIGSASLAGCASAPVSQINYFSQALDSVNSVGQPLLDDLAVAERQQGQRIVAAAGALPNSSCRHSSITSGGSTVLLDFCNEDSIYFADVAEPPATTALRAGLAVLRQYADLLVTLAEAKNVSEAAGQINSLNQNIGQLTTILAGATLPVPVVTAALDNLKPILETAAKQLSIREARKVILSGAPQVTNLIDALQRAAPALFATVTSDIRRRLEREDIKNPSAAAADKSRYETYRRLVADYVALLDKLRNAWIQTVRATENPSPPTLADLADQARTLEADAASMRRVYSNLRIGSPATSP